MTSSIGSFTAAAIYNKYTLNVLFPSNCELKEIKQEGDSLLEAISEAQHSGENVFDSPANKSKWHKPMKPVRMLARTVYTVAVATIVSPLGALFNFIRLSGSLAKWMFYELKDDQSKKMKTVEKIKEYSAYFFEDLINTLYGLFYAFLLSASATSIAGTTPVWYPVAIGAYACILGSFTEAFTPDKALTKSIAYSNERTQMYLSLALRNHFGICGKNGMPLKFSEADSARIHIIKKPPRNNNRNLDQNNTEYDNKSRTKLWGLFAIEEEKFLVEIRKAKAFLKKNGKQLAYSFPFDGNAVASKIADVFKTKNIPVSTPMKALIKRLIAYENKMELFRDIEANAQIIHQDFILQETRLNFQKSFMTEDYYRQQFAIPYQAINFAAIGLDGVSLDAVNNADDTYETFKHRVCLNITKAQRNVETDPLCTLLGLDENYTEAELKKAYRMYALTMHTDKNQHRAGEAHKLFQVLDDINRLLKAEIECLDGHESEENTPGSLTSSASTSATESKKPNNLDDILAMD